MRAAVLAEDALGTKLGKTANGLVLHSVQDQIVAALDSTRAGQDAGEVVNGVHRGIPVVATLQECIDAGAERLYVGVATPGGFMPAAFAAIVKDALRAGMEVVNGLHGFLSEQEEFVAAAQSGGGRIWDVRKPPTDLRCADGAIFDCPTPRILIMGQDCDIGKRVTAVQLRNAAVASGVNLGFVATGQTGCMLGADAGAVIDRIPADFAAGQVEKMVCQVAPGKDVVLIYGQASIFHPAFSGVTAAILHGAMPDAIILQVAPGRQQRVLFDHPRYTLRSVADEIKALELLSGAPVVALAMNPTECPNPEAAAAELAAETGLPVIDPLGGDVSALWDVAWSAVRPTAVATAPAGAAATT